MEPVTLLIDERLASTGDALPLQGHIDQASYSLGDHDFSLPSGIDYDLVATNAGEGILVTGIIRAHVVGVCDRCLETAEFDIAGEVDGYYLFEEPEQIGDDEDSVDYFLVSDDDTVDITGALNQALIFETPYVVLCQPDCKGLCPVCGANLNEGDCGHDASSLRASIAESPFAALAALDINKTPNVE